jgi:hypothetical protein
MSTTVLTQANSSRTRSNIFYYAAVNGTSMFILSYLVVYFIGQLSTFLVAHYSYPLTAFFYYNKIDFPIEERLWHTDLVAPVFSVAPRVALAFAGLCWVMFRFLEDKGSIWKQFFFWGLLHGINLGLGTIISGVFTRDGAWYVLQWSLTYNPLIIVAAFVSFLAMIGAGLWATSLFFRSCDSITLMQNVNRRGMLRAMLILPWILGSVFVGFLKYPISGYDHLLIYTLMFLLIPIYIRSQSMLVNDRVHTPRRTYIAWGLVGLVVVLSLGIRLALHAGIKIH